MFYIIPFKQLRAKREEAEGLRKYDTFEEVQIAVCVELHYNFPNINFIPDDFILEEKLSMLNYGDLDWDNIQHLCIKGINEVSDKESFKLLFGGEYDNPLFVYYVSEVEE